MYEYYYTQKPTNPEDPEDFLKTYDFRFADLNCVAYFDLCAKIGIKSYPTTILFHNGEAKDTVRGAKDMKLFGDIIERALEEVKPGSRPKPGKLSLPPPKATVWPKENHKDEKPPSPAQTEEAMPTKNAQSSVEQSEVPDVKEDATVNEPNTGSEKAEIIPEKEQEKVEELPVTPTNRKTPYYYDEPIYPIPTIEKSTQMATPNPDGISVALDAEKFRDKVTLTEDAWFIKFYAPWCHHCQALAPVWEQVGKSMKGQLNVGEVNCDRENRLCKDVGVSGFPTIYFFKGGERVEYQGLRGLGDFAKFADKAVAASEGVKDVSLEEFQQLEEKEEVIFVYFYDHAATSEDFNALERLPLPLIGRARIVRTRDPRMYERFKITTWPRLLVSREGRPTYYQPLTPRAMRDGNGIMEWMKSVWLPIVPELSATNAREIMDGKMVVLGILNRDETDSYLRALKEMKTAANEWMDKQIQQFQLERQELRDAKQLRIEEAQDRGDSRALRQAKNIRINMDMSDRKQVAFAWVDGVFWQRWVRTTFGIDVANGERVIINDEDVSDL